MATVIESAPAPRQHSCPECGKPVVRKSPKGRAPIFCEKKCATAMERRKLADGRAIIVFAKAWRISRNNKANAPLGAQCLSAMSAIIDLQNERDRKAGITSEMTLAYAERLLEGDSYFDRSTSARWKREHEEVAE